MDCRRRTDQLPGRRTARSVGERAVPPRLRAGFAPYSSGSRHVRPDRRQNTPGPVRGIDRDQLRRGATPRLVPPRNPRIGELFKEIGLAEKRLTGLGKIYQAMERNGSPPPEFYFDEQRTFFQATLFGPPLAGAPPQQSGGLANCARWVGPVRRRTRSSPRGGPTPRRSL